MSSSSSVQTELSHTAESHDEEDVFDDAVSTIESVRASWAHRADEPRAHKDERAWAEHRHRERLVYYQKRQSMRIEAERELLERHLRLGHQDARREAARKAQLLAAEMAREQEELARLFEREVQQAQQRRAAQQAQASRDAEAEERRRLDDARRREDDERQRREARDRRAQQEQARIEEQLRLQRQEAARQERLAREEASRRAREEQEALRASMRFKSMDEILQARVTAYEARLGTRPTRSPIEERARQRAQRLSLIHI